MLWSWVWWHRQRQADLYIVPGQAESYAEKPYLGVWGAYGPWGAGRMRRTRGKGHPFPPITIYIQFCDSPPRGPKGKLAENNILLNSPGNNTLLNSSPQRI